MLWVSYGRVSQEGVKGMLANPSNRAEAVAKLIGAFGGELVSYHMLMNGNIDFFIVFDIPEDRITDSAIINAMLVRGSGAIESISTVPAVRAEDAMALMQKAQKMASAMAYQAPTK